MTNEPGKRVEAAIELDVLKQDVQKLQADLRDMILAVGEQGKEKLLETKKKLQVTLKHLKGEATEKFGEAYDSFREHGEEAVEKSREAIQDRPITCVLIAFGVGILLGSLIQRR